MSSFFPEDPTRWVTVDGRVRLAAYTRGTGEPLVLINGLGASVHDWGPTVEILARNRRLIAFDTRGAGRSAAPDVPMCLEELADDAASVLEAYGLESTDVVGYSMGGMVAQILAVHRPERVRRLVLMATHAGARSAVRSMPRARAVMSIPDDQPRKEVARMQYEAFVAPD
ncbi:MAG: alpha/beta fold hydrolase, partial [Longimicrobiales bacterium]